jgi:hypothetical protein
MGAVAGAVIVWAFPTTMFIIKQYSFIVKQGLGLI